MLDSLNIGCTSYTYCSRNDPGTGEAIIAGESLLDHIEAYFAEDHDYPQDIADPSEIHQTTLAPIYLQHHGHSLTIIGIQLASMTNPDKYPRSLLVFDPAYKTSPAMHKIIDNGPHRFAAAGNGPPKSHKSVRSHRKQTPQHFSLSIEQTAQALKHYRRPEQNLKRYDRYEIVM